MKSLGKQLSRLAAGQCVCVCMCPCLAVSQTHHLTASVAGISASLLAFQPFS